MILASAVPEILTGAPKFKVGHVTPTRPQPRPPLLRVICHQYVGTWRSLHVYKIWPL